MPVLRDFVCPLAQDQVDFDVGQDEDGGNSSVPNPEMCRVILLKSLTHPATESDTAETPNAPTSSLVGSAVRETSGTEDKH